MIENYSALVKYFQRALRKIIRQIFDIMPLSINIFFATKGYTYLTSRKKSFFFIKSIYGTNFKIKAHSLSNIDRVATGNRVFSDDFTYSYSDPVYGIFALNLKNWTMIDIGANVGTYSIASVSAGADKIYAIEPGKYFKNLKYNIKLNNLEKKITAYDFGISDFEGQMKWYEELNNLGNAHLLRDKRDLNFLKTKTVLSNNFKTVKVQTLKSFITENNINKIDLIKIDVEGMEWDILKGNEDIIEKYEPIFLIETHRIMSDILDYDCITPIFNFFYKLNYKSYSFENKKFINFVYPNFPMDTFFIKDINSLEKKD